jgi:hypothetical protein
MSSSSAHLTVGEVAEIFDSPTWKVRRVVDSLKDEIPRAGLYRLIPRHLLPKIGARLHESADALQANGGETPRASTAEGNHESGISPRTESKQ